MRRVGILIAVLLLAPGCFVFDELDKGNAILDAHSPNRNKRKQAEKEAGGAKLAKDEAESPSELQRKWWEGAHTLGPTAGNASDPFVSCRVHGSTRLTKQSDCLAQGGTPSAP